MSGVLGRAGRAAALAEALDGRFTDHHAQLARMLLDQIDELTARIGTVTELLDAAIAALPAEPATGPAGPLAPPPAQAPDAAPARFAATVQRLAEIPGAGPDSVRAVIGEIGLDMTVFGTHQRPPAPWPWACV